ncbi:MAG: hypothetical protein JWP29_5384 [Rhodoferax sp.]|nr:hypothetical protein [Rhodoferax sp.]
MLFHLKKLSLAAAVALCITATPAAQASPVYDNLGTAQVGSDPLYSYGPIANSFNTGANGSGMLTGVKALLANFSSDIVGSLQISLHANGVNAPGAELVSLGSLSSAGVAAGAFAAYTFAPVTAFELAANTTYWIEIASASANDVFWSWSDDLSALGVAGQANYSAALGYNLNSSSFGPYQMAVEVPEPGSVALVFLGLALVCANTARRRKPR